MNILVGGKNRRWVSRGELVSNMYYEIVGVNWVKNQVLGTFTIFFLVDFFSGRVVCLISFLMR